MSSNPTISQDPLMRHDLFEINRKRKLLVEEVETIQKRRCEELEALKRVEARKDALLKELNVTQQAIQKEKKFMRQLEKEILTKSRYNQGLLSKGA